jgi:predicted DNA-binding protein
MSIQLAPEHEARIKELARQTARDILLVCRLL